MKPHIPRRLFLGEAQQVETTIQPWDLLYTRRYEYVQCQSQSIGDLLSKCVSYLAKTRPINKQNEMRREKSRGRRHLGMPVKNIDENEAQ